MDAGTKKLIALPWTMLTGIPITLFAGLVVADYWSWFISPTFGFAAISYLQAVGLMLFVGLFKVGLTHVKPDENDHPIVTTFVMQLLMVVVWLIIWGIGAIWSLFI